MMNFSFGKNWQAFLKKYNSSRLEQAVRSLARFLQMASLEGKTFLDIGCGSGLFSYSAYKLRAERIVSFDVDPDSVACCRILHAKAQAPASWQILKGSILDPDFIASLGYFDIVYSWGVLHHTGKMWAAIRQAAALVNAGGYFYIAIYNKVEGCLGSLFWHKIKRLYNRGSWIVKYTFIMAQIVSYFIIDILKFRNPVTRIIKYKKDRGMDWVTDVKDWLGGYPYEFASAGEIIRFMQAHCKDFSLVNTEIDKGLGCNSYLFIRNR
jgi:2-polyprenyl-6-hydroxyphenyl methylase/3-demethylubiquinone-9 3-methyltransferase